MESFGFVCLVPALVTILVALSTHRVATGVFFGIASAAFIKTGGVLALTFPQLFAYLKVSFTNVERLKICVFLIFVGFTIDLIDVSGGYKAFSKLISRHLTSPRKTRISTFLLSLSFFVDDYANVLVCGASMRGMAKPHKISPAMLAYIVDRTATVASVIVISTWAAFESSIMVSAAENVNLNKKAAEFFFSTLPFHVSTYFGLLLVLFTAWQGKWFGAYLDKINLTSQSIIEKVAQKAETKIDSHSTANLIIPIATLIFSGALLIVYFAIDFAINSEVKPTLIMVLGNLPTVEILVFSSFLSWLSVLALIKRGSSLDYKSVLSAHKSGFLKMVSPAMVIILAKGLSVASSQIGVGTFIATGIEKHIVVELIPGAIFLISMFITIATGFSWSAMVIVMPIAFELGVSNAFAGKLPIVAGAVISGAISGALMIPYSDKTVLTAAAFNISPIYHAKTQFLQALIASISAIIFYIIFGYGGGYYFSILAGITFITIMQLVFAKKDSHASIKT